VNIAKSDEALMAASVVPLQAQSIHPSTKTLVQNTLKIFYLFIASTFGVCRLAEEIGRWQLLRIAHYRQLLSSGDSTNGIPYWNLRGLVKNH
jgi:hypothetical protein